MKNDSEYTLKAKGLVERIGMEVGVITHKPAGKKYVIEKPIPDHTEGIKSVLNLLVDKEKGVLNSLKDIEACGHRVAHGGETFPKSCLVSDKVIEGINRLAELAPLHNPANLLGIKAIKELMPNIPQVAVFDTAFHQTMEAPAFMYAIPYEYYENYRVRRYGFHGTSHKYVAYKACELSGLDINNSKIVTCHLGNGGSVTAIKNGKSIDTSMGFTPMAGVVMGTRCGDVDPGLVSYLEKKENLTGEESNSILNKKSGLLGISGISSDCRDVEEAANKGNARAKLALDMFSLRVKKYIGAYAAEMGGIDMIVFTGGIGENDTVGREIMCEGLDFIGVKFDPKKNDGVHGEDKILSADDSKVIVTTISTNEELMIARDTMHLSLNK